MCKLGSQLNESVAAQWLCSLAGYFVLLSLTTQLLLGNFGISCKTSLIIASHPWGGLKSCKMSAQAEWVQAGTQLDRQVACPVISRAPNETI